jgi:hypothetical protein
VSAVASPTTVDPPSTFPLDHLSVSSLDLYSRCPEKWRRRYIDHEPDRPSAKMILGGAAGAALVQSFGLQIERGMGLSTDELLDEFSSEWEDRLEREDIDFEKETPGALKDSAVAALRVYHRQLAPDVIPASVERPFELSWPGCPFDLIGFIDLETADGGLVDFKTTGKRWGAEKAGAELQPTVYLAAKRAEGNPAAGFAYHLLIRTKQATAEIVPTARTETQLDLLTYRVFSIARSIEWRWRNDCWQGAPPDLAWLCRGCGYDSCAWRLA